MKSMILALMAAGLVAGPITAKAAIIYDNFGPGDAFDTTSGYTIGPISTFNYTQGFQFTADSTAYFDSLIVAMTKNFSTPSPHLVSFHLYSDDGNAVGSLLETVTVVVNLSAEAGSGGEIVSGTASGATLLSAGVNYWLLAESADSNSWRLNSTGATGLRYLFDSLGASPPSYSPSATLGVFRISGSNGASPVPEPATLALVGLGLVGMGLAGRRKTNSTTA